MRLTSSKGCAKRLRQVKSCSIEHVESDPYDRKIHSNIASEGAKAENDLCEQKGADEGGIGRPRFGACRFSSDKGRIHRYKNGDRREIKNG